MIKHYCRDNIDQSHYLRDDSDFEEKWAQNESTTETQPAPHSASQDVTENTECKV